jgi:hypothetical protein
MKARPDGSNEARLVDVEAADQGQTFFLANEGIFYRPREMNGEIWFLRFVDGKTRRILKPEKPMASGMSVSPDGHWLPYTQQDGQPGSDLMLVEDFH